MATRNGQKSNAGESSALKTTITKVKKENPGLQFTSPKANGSMSIISPSLFDQIQEHLYKRQLLKTCLSLAATREKRNQIC